MSLRERHLDYLIAEEFESSVAFATWVAEKAFGQGTLPGDDPSCRAEVGHFRASGETDILVTLTWQSGEKAVIHIEDKLTANPQPEQALRYAKDIKASAERAVSLLMAPDAWMLRHTSESDLFDCCISFEEVAAHLGTRAQDLEENGSVASLELARRLRCRQQLFDVRQRIQRAVAAIGARDIDDWNADAADVIAAVNDIKLEVAPRQRTTGAAKRGRHIRFNERMLPSASGHEVTLQLKTKEAQPGRVSLQVPENGTNSALRSSAAAAGFTAGATGTNTLLIDATTPALRDLDLQRPVRDQVDRLEAAASAAQQIIVWWQREGCRM
ncbi:MAG: hypothetical protein IT361_06360 [Gemmatimonadaceae bacterium]|nr:hypothetical protein [Gemmatimonadaceae bacterium]